MEHVRCTNCGSTAIVPDGSGEFCRCDACGSTFNVSHAAAFSKVELDHTQDIRAWREYLAKQLHMQQESAKARDYGGVKLFAQKILSVLPDDFCAQYYVALAERFDDNDTAFIGFLNSVSFDGVTPDERKEVVDSLVATIEPKYLDTVKNFIMRIYPQTYVAYDAALDAGIKKYIQKLRYAKVNERDVFICHRTTAPDQDVADAICSRLEERGLRCWIAPRNILAGSQNYERDIMKGVENCKIFLLVSSFKSIYSEDCEMELKTAVLSNKALYSYKIDDTPYDGAFEKAMSSVQWLDASDDPFAHLEQLVIDIKGMLARDEREKAELEEKRIAAREKERLESEQMRKREQERLERLENLVTRGVAATSTQLSTIKSRLKRAELELGSGNFKRAESVIDETLDADPENGLAWWLLMLSDYRVKTDAELIALNIDFTVNRYYANAERFADSVLKTRIEKAMDDFTASVIKDAAGTLDLAERKLNADDFDGLKDLLTRLDGTFENENGLIFRKYPDVASKYYWLKLWCKYGQSPLVCVEDITRETEYALAVKYASPIQAQEYGKACETVSQNAQAFLRERSKNYANDNKLIDYLADNKGILPLSVYNKYSSMMYFRKMLKQINMTEEQLARSTADISTNEYFMLAQSMASDEQRYEYDELLKTLDANRSDRTREQACAKQHAANAARHEQTVTKRNSTAMTVVIALSATVSYGLLLYAMFMIFVDMEVALGFFSAATALRIVSDAVSMLIKKKAMCVLNICGLVATAFTVLGVLICIFFAHELVFSNVGLIIVAFIVGSVAIGKHKPKK